MDSKKYNTLDPSLHKISNYMSLKEDEMKEVNKQLKEVLESHLLPTMKEVDKDFNVMFQRLHYSGSYYENLRICKANEFDLNLELRSQKGSKKGSQKILDTTHPGFVHMQYLSGDINRKWVNENGYVMQNKVRNWLQGVVHKALEEISDAPWDKISFKTSGPAVTLCIEYDQNIFTVDLVPVFVLDSSQWPKPPVRQPIIRNNSYAEQWCVVPKPNNLIDQNGCTGTFWRMSFYNQEKSLLNNRNHLKNALKLMKLLRDQEDWQWLKSYFLKTVCLWSFIERDEHFWNSGIGVIFMDMLKTLRYYLKVKQSIPFFWDENLNLLNSSSVHVFEIQKIGNRLERIIKNIDRNIEKNNPKYIETLYPTFVSSIRTQSLPSSEESLHTETMQEDEVDEIIQQINEVGETIQQATGLGGSSILIGIGALAISVLFGRFFNNTENRDQRDRRDRRNERDCRDQRD